MKNSELKLVSKYKEIQNKLKKFKIKNWKKI